MATLTIEEAKSLILWAKENGVSKISFGSGGVEAELVVGAPFVEPGDIKPELVQAFMPVPEEKGTPIKSGRYAGLNEEDVFPQSPKVA